MEIDIKGPDKQTAHWEVGRRSDHACGRLRPVSDLSRREMFLCAYFSENLQTQHSEGERHVYKVLHSNLLLQLREDA